VRTQSLRKTFENAIVAPLTPADTQILPTLKTVPGVPEQRLPPPARSRTEPADLGQVPSTARLLCLAGWAAALGLVGLLIGTVGLVAALTNAPVWYEPVLILIGLAGVGLTVGAFWHVHSRYAPWLMLLGATAALALSFIVTAAAS
jgi:hypothetical protein